MKHTEVQRTLRAMADPAVAEHSSRFFKTAPEEYGEGDRFLGIRVPRLRKVARDFVALSLAETEQLLRSGFHEERMCALIILVNKFSKGSEEERKRIFDLYMKNIEQVNSWDLVDTSAEHIIGSYLSDKRRELLYTLAKSESLWERRIAIISTFHFIKKGEFNDALSISELLLNDEEDLIHKAVGWMLREIGKRDQKLEERFLYRHISKMPRTMLRYAIEKFPENRRQFYLKL